MAEAAAHLVDHVIPRGSVRHWVFSFPIPLRSLFATHPEVFVPVLRIITGRLPRFSLSSPVFTAVRYAYEQQLQRNPTGCYGSIV